MTATGKNRVRVRFAPSPTGLFHIGNARAALFNWLFARHENGTFVLRIEDTDRERSKKVYEEEIFEGLTWLGITWDEGPMPPATSYKGNCGPYRQSERTRIYERYIEKLLSEGKAYYCYCSKEDIEAERQSLITQGLPPKYSGHCRNLTAPPGGKAPTSIRFKMPETEITFKDMIRGAMKFDAALFGDVVIAKDASSPLYNFAVIVDDHEMNITHVIRGEDHLPNTPKQILFSRALGFGEPEYGHLPLILSPDRSKLSKRYAETSLLSYRTQGFLPEAVVNFIALLGWHSQSDKEIFTLAELVDEFTLRRVQKGGAAFNQEKLEWLNVQHLKKLSDDDMVNRLKIFFGDRPETSAMFHDTAFFKKAVHVERDRLKLLREFPDTAGFFFTLPDYEGTLLIWNEASMEKVSEVLRAAFEILKNVGEDRFAREILLSALGNLIAREGRGLVLWPLRVAVSGRTASPDPIEIMEVLGKSETLKRIGVALQKAEHHAS